MGRFKVALLVLALSLALVICSDPATNDGRGFGYPLTVGNTNLTQQEIDNMRIIMFGSMGGDLFSAPGPSSTPSQIDDEKEDPLEKEEYNYGDEMFGQGGRIEYDFPKVEDYDENTSSMQGLLDFLTPFGNAEFDSSAGPTPQPDNMPTDPAPQPDDVPTDQGETPKGPKGKRKRNGQGKTPKGLERKRKRNDQDGTLRPN
jgi:hypothetical protein